MRFLHLADVLIQIYLGTLEIALCMEENILGNYFNQFKFTNHSSMCSSL